HLIPGHGGLMDRLDGFVTASVAAGVIRLARGGFEGPGRGPLGWGVMKPGILRAAGDPAPAGGTGTLLGAPGSIRGRPPALLKRERERFRVEAVSAHKNAAALATLARELGARFAAIGDPAAYGELKSALSGTGIKAAGGESGLLEAAERPAEWVIGAITGA